LLFSIVYNFDAGVPHYYFKMNPLIAIVFGKALPKSLLSMGNALPIAHGFPNGTGIHGLEGEQNMKEVKLLRTRDKLANSFLDSQRRLGEICGQ
jgi:hypothetical protein